MTPQYKLAAALFCSVSLLEAQPSNAPARLIGPLITQMEIFVEQGMQKTGVPGVAVAVVYQDKVVYLKGFGVRKAGEPALVDADTIFQLASVSKSISSTVVAALVGGHEVNWDDKIADLDPDFQLSDPNATGQLTIRDLLSHRSGLPVSAGDVLEDLGFSRPEILHQMRLLRLTEPLRKKFQYSNFPYTEGGIAAAKAVRTQWEDVAAERLFKPLGMTSSSFRWSDYRDSLNKAAIHVLVDGKPVARYLRNPDAEAPAGSASSSVRDLAEWLRLQITGGIWNGQQTIAADALNETHSPQIAKGGTDPLTGGTAYYGLGWNVSYDASGKSFISHSGAFSLGAGTTVMFSPADQLGIVVLTNAVPTGLAEAAAYTFFDLYEHGKLTQDWLTFFVDIFQNLLESINNETTDYSKLNPPASPTPSKPLSAYIGTYSNSYYGEIKISKAGESLWMRLPADGALYTLTHWDGDTFTYRYKGDPGNTARGVKFTFGSPPQILIENLAVEGNGTFVRID